MSGRPKSPHPYRVTITRYTTPDGRRCDSTTPGAVAERVESQNYYVDLYPKGVRKRYPLGTSDLAQAHVEMNKLRRQHAEQAAGITSPYTTHAGRPIREHLDAWLQALTDESTDPERVKLLRSRLTILIAEAGWARINDVTPTSCRAALGRLQQDAAGRRGLSAQTRNHYLGHVKQFIAWCVGDRRLLENALARVRPVDVSTDRRHDRRSPTDEEVAALLGHLVSGTAKVRRGMTGPQRALGYKVAMATGFRAGELRSLNPAAFDLDACTATIHAAYDKRGREAVQPLPSWLVTELREWFAAGGGCWEGFPRQHPGRVLVADLEAAGVPVVVDGAFFDFHAMRSYYVTQIANQPGMSPKTMMTLARHSTADLSLKIYAKVRQEDLRKAADAIPNPGQKPSDQ